MYKRLSINNLLQSIQYLIDRKLFLSLTTFKTEDFVSL